MAGKVLNSGVRKMMKKSFSQKKTFSPQLLTRDQTRITSSYF
jgi:hypothetical protein